MKGSSLLALGSCIYPCKAPLQSEARGSGFHSLCDTQAMISTFPASLVHRRPDDMDKERAAVLVRYKDD